MSQIISVQNLHKIYHAGNSAIHALAGVSLTVEKGEFVAITGTSGSGKSTLLNILAGLEPPTAGNVTVAGVAIEKLNESGLADFRGRSIGFVFQSFNLIPTMTASENVALPLLFKGFSKRKRIQTAGAVLKSMGLERHSQHLPHQLSGGQQQRVGIARALAAAPPVLFADEPTGNLDSQNSRMIITYLHRLSKEKNQTVLMVTHDRALAGEADRIICLSDGRIVR